MSEMRKPCRGDHHCMNWRDRSCPLCGKVASQERLMPNTIEGWVGFVVVVYLVLWAVSHIVTAIVVK